MREEIRAKAREDLMEILDDSDGGKLKGWYRLYCDNLLAFRERARQYARTKREQDDIGCWMGGMDEPDPQ